VIETKEVYTLIEVDIITVNQPDGETVKYEREPVPISNVHLEDKYVR
jgi:hypothetical protein